MLYFTEGYYKVTLHRLMLLMQSHSASYVHYAHGDMLPFRVLNVRRQDLTSKAGSSIVHYCLSSYLLRVTVNMTWALFRG